MRSNDLELGLANLQIYGFAKLGTSIPVSQPQFSAQFESSQPNFTSPDSPISMWPRERWLQPEISLGPGRAEYEKKGHPSSGKTRRRRFVSIPVLGSSRNAQT